jgi:hypothetical protein
MGDFQNAVLALLDAFARGIAVIRTQRMRRKEKLAIASTHKTAETRLSKSLKKNKASVQDAYDKDLARIGPGFAAGDGELKPPELESGANSRQPKHIRPWPRSSSA